LTDLLNDLAGVSSSLVLVLDDYHAINESAIHDALAFLLAHAPPCLHIVIATRADPALPIPRLRARGEVTELRQDDLVFTPEEAAAFLTQSMGLALTAAESAVLEQRTEGWIAGLQLAALSMQTADRQGLAKAQHVAPFIANFSGQYHVILDYLTEEILKRQPPYIQTFLLYTAILDKMCGALCDALLVSPIDQDEARPLPHKASRDILEQLAHANLFLVPLDYERQWYRYHQLFADLLRAQWHRGQADVVMALHRRAANWYQEQGMHADAIRHALAAEAHDWAAVMIEQALQQPDAWSAITAASLLKWLAVLPDTVIQAHPQLMLMASRVFYVTGKQEQAMQMLETLEPATRAALPDPEARNLLGLITADRASYAAVEGKIQQAITLAEQALDYLAEGSLPARMRTTSTLGLAYVRAGNVREATRAFTQAIAAAEEAGIPAAATPFACNLADIQITQGCLRQAMQTCQQAMRTATGASSEAHAYPTTGYVHIEMAKILYEKNDLPAALYHVTDGLAHLEQGGIPDSFGVGHALLAHIQQAQGDDDAAMAAMQQAVAIAHSSGMSRFVHLMAAHQARLWLAQGQRRQAVDWAKAYRQLPPVEYLREFEDLTLVWVLAEDKPSDALVYLDSLQPAAEAAGRIGTVLEAALLRALARQALGDSDSARRALQYALELAEPEGYVRLFADAGPPVAQLLLHIHPSQADGPLARYIAHLLAVCAPQDAGAPQSQPTVTQPADLIEPLTARELDVLHLLEEGLTNPEIAQRLYISLPTVKSHTRNIYGKLGVHSRKQAVVQAKLLNIL
jgi:LuxR family maltose regulon positive regulatory protein